MHSFPTHSFPTPCFQGVEKGCIENKWVKGVCQDTGHILHNPLEIELKLNAHNIHWLLSTNCLNVFDHFVGLAYKGLDVL